MFLQRLKEYADRLDLPPRLYSDAPVRYIIELDATGSLLSDEPTDTADPSDRRTRNGQRRGVPRVQRASGIRPLLLSDHAAYTLGLPREGKAPEREKACHEAYMAQLARCAEDTGEARVSAVLRFLMGSPTDQLKLPEEFDRSANLTFRVDGTLPVDLASVQAFWLKENSPGEDVMQCLVCGQQRPPMKRLKEKIKGIPGGQSSGTSIISANEDAYESYGLEASLIAPICGDCAERMTKALNHLLRDDSHHFSMAKSVFVFWTQVEEGGSVLDLLKSPSAADVKALMQSVYGRAGPPVEENRFYAAVLSASGGRAVVRNWIETTLGQVERNLARWFQRQSIVGAFGEAPEPLGLYALAGTTVRDGKDILPRTVDALLSAALGGQPIPAGILQQTVQRTRAEQRVTRAQAALIKLALVTAKETGYPKGLIQSEEDDMVTLDVNNSNPAYLCGRLLAVLESAQRQAIPTAGATIIDRFYGSASSAPATVFGSLLRGAQAHLSKLQRDRRGAYHAIQQRLEEVLAGLDSFPRTLSLDEQAVFALGYYHQRAADRAGSKEAAEKKRESADDAAS